MTRGASENQQPLWWLFGGMLLIALSILIVQSVFPPDIGINTPTVRYEDDRFVVTSQVVNHTIHPVVLHLRFKVFRVTDGKQRNRGEEFGRKEVTASVAGSTSVTAKCEFPYKEFPLSAADAEVQMLAK